MAERAFMKGNEALALAALRSGLNFFAGYPITPASEIPEYLAEKYQADRIRAANGERPEFPDFIFLQAESEIASINMVLGAAATGALAMTASSSPGVTLAMEGVSYIHGSELPAVLIDVMRGGPGLGNIGPEQSDYNQVVKGGGHGSYQNIVLAPNNIQEMYDFVPLAFDLAFKYRLVVVVLVDGCLGQMQESIDLHPIRPCCRYDVVEWALDDNPARRRRVITSLRIEPERLEEHVYNLKSKYDRIQADEPRAEAYLVDDAEIVCVAYGITSRIVKGAVNALRQDGHRVGLIRPITLWPFPSGVLRDAAQTARAFLTVELSLGQFVDDVRLAVNGRREVDLHTRAGGMLPSETELIDRIRAMAGRGRQAERRLDVRPALGT